MLWCFLNFELVNLKKHVGVIKNMENRAKINHIVEFTALFFIKAKIF